MFLFLGNEPSISFLMGTGHFNNCGQIGVIDTNVRLAELSHFGHIMAQLWLSTTIYTVKTATLGLKTGDYGHWQS